eukprot:gnl/Spiro4/20848_TR10150_c0_g1_i1.p1 gnl/Spiro4/20848_TR10150_c0_g1~~gnl/Spiro4/20848_TR10150_c0_g1_i1.p1  ORF type:complete len:117 (+),score=40.85 gnl/Spiro4/20848_TR10150_c0_g1_i1:40-351(+)
MAQATPTPDQVKLISNTGTEFLIDRKAAMLSGTIKSMLSSSGFVESVSNEITFPEISTQILDKVCQYLQYKLKYNDSTTTPPEFEIEPEIALELLMAANFLDT